MVPVNPEDDDLLQEQLKKRGSSIIWEPDTSAASTSQFNPLEEPGPLGLRLSKSPLLLESIQLKLSQENDSKIFRASNISALLLMMGTRELDKQPFLLWEKPGQHSRWQKTSDFTNGQASQYRQHLMECPQGLFRHHFEKLTESDPCLYSPSQKAEITSVSLYFEPIASGFDDTNVSKGPHVCNIDWELSDFFDLDDAASPSGTQYYSSKNKHQEFLGMPLEHFSPESPLPGSVMDASVMGRNQEP